MKGTAVVLSLSSVLFLAGCGVSIVNDAQSAAGTTSSSAVLSLQGTVHGGTQAISSASVQLWTVGTSGYGYTGSVVASATSNGSGIFSLPSYTCSPTTELVYLTATSGNPGLSGTNPMNTAISLMTALGPCNAINSSTKVELDEATTVASVYALAQFMNYSTGAVGYPAASSVGITNAFATVHNLVNTSVGNALSYTPAGNGLVPAAEINTLANMLAYCVNSSGSTASGQPCAKVFAATTYSSSVPANTLQAILNVALHPAYNPTGQFNVVSSSGPFQPTLTTAPNDWTMPVLYSSVGIASADLAIDASGNIWTANFGGSGNGSIDENNNLGSPVAQYEQGNDGLDAIAIDLGGNAWATNYYNAQIYEVVPGSTPLGPFSFQETTNTQAIAVDPSNNVWITNAGSGTVTEIGNHGATSRALSPTGGYSLGNSSQPVGVAIDASGDAWVTDEGSNSLSKITPAGSISSTAGGSLYSPSGIAVDASGDLWVTNAGFASSGGSSLVVEFNNAGTQTGAYTSGTSLELAGSFDAVDGGNNIWVANELNNSVSVLNASGTALSPAAGYLGPNITVSSTSYSGAAMPAPFEVRIDQSGNAWVLNHNGVPTGVGGSNALLTELVGLATPTIEPLAVAAQQGLIGQKPGTSPGTTLVVTTSSLPNGINTTKYSVQLLAKGGTGNGYAWTVASGATTLSNLGLTLSSSGLLSGTLSGTVSGAAIGFKVTDSSGSTAQATLSLTVNSLTTLSITTTNLASGTVATNYSQGFAATGGSGSYTWSIPSTSQQSALSAIGLGLSLSGYLGGTPTAATTGITFTVKVTDLATNQTASAPFTLVVNNPPLSQCTHDGTGNAILSGHYAFLLTGFDSYGNVLDQIGSFQANGAGSITNGLGDSNNSGNASAGEQSFTFTGTYSVGSTDKRGQMVINSSNNTNPQYFCFAADSVSGGVATSGRVIDATGDGSIQTGVFQIQIPVSGGFTTGQLTGGYAFGVQGENAGTPLQRGGLVGQLTLNGSGSVSSGQVDIATYKTANSATTYTPAAALSSGGTYTMGTGGRGTLTISNGGGGATFIIYQFGSGNGFFMLSSANINTNTLLAGYAMQQQQSNFTTGSVLGKGVFREDGLSGSGADDAEIGQIGLDGSGNLSFIADENNAGVISSTPITASANYTVTSLGYLQIANAGSETPNFYLYGPGGGFGLDSSNPVGLWVMVPQTGAGSFTSSSLSGSYAIGTVNPLGYSTTGAGVSSGNPYPDVFDATATFASGTISLVQDEVESPGTIPYVSTGQTGSESYTLDPTYGASAGRFTLGDVVGYIVSPTQVILMDTNSGKNPQVLVGDHQ